MNHDQLQNDFYLNFEGDMQAERIDDTSAILRHQEVRRDYLEARQKRLKRESRINMVSHAILWSPLAALMCLVGHIIYMGVLV